MKQERTRFLIKHVAEKAFLNRMADGLTLNMFAAMWFHKQEEATHWLQEGRYAPKEPGYEVVETLTTLQEVGEDVQNERIDHQFSDSHSSV